MESKLKKSASLSDVPKPTYLNTSPYSDYSGLNSCLHFSVAELCFYVLGCDFTTLLESVSDLD